jgi:hypothetical protein
MNCEIFLDVVGSYVDETLDEEHRKWFRRHLRECASCRQSALRHEPSLIFATATEVPADPEAVEACATAVAAHIRQDRMVRRLRSRRLPWMAAAAALVMAIGVGFIWQTMVGGEQAGQPLVETAQELDPAASPPSVEVEAMGEEVRVYQFATDGDDDTAVYFIVDPALEL